MNDSTYINSNIQFSLSGNKIIYNNNKWDDVTNFEEIKNNIHPILAENINLKKRRELLVKLVAESEYINQNLEVDINEATQILDELNSNLNLNNI